MFKENPLRIQMSCLFVVLQDFLYDNGEGRIQIFIIFKPITIFFLMRMFQGFFFVMLTTLITIAQSGKISTMNTTITNPFLLSICEKRPALVVAGGSKVEVFSNLHKQYTRQSFIMNDPILLIKCLKQGFVAVATKNKFCIVDPSSSDTPKCKSINGRPLSIAEQPDNNLTFLLISENFLELSELHVKNYGISFNKTTLPFLFLLNIVTASYVANRQYIYTSDDFNQLSLFRNPFDVFPDATIHVKDLGLLKDIKGLENINSALLTDFNGNFALVKEEKIVGTWTETPYQRGCLCTKEKFALANNKKLAIYDFQQVKLYDSFTINDLVDVACMSDDQNEKVYLLDSSGKIVVVNIDESSQGSFFVYILILVAIVITIAAIRFMWFTPKQSMSTDLDDASKQDRQNVYRELKQYKQKDVVKETL